METSDSECFESADEEFISDTEDTKLKTSKLQTRLEEVKIVNNEKPSHMQSKNDSVASNNGSTIVSTSSRSDVSEQMPEKRNKPPRTTLGVKLGKNLRTTTKREQTPETNKMSDKQDVKSTTVHDQETLLRLGTKKQTISTPEMSIPTDEQYRKCIEEHNINLDEENMWEDDDWEPITETKSPTENKTNEAHKEHDDNTFASNWTSWSNWGVSSLLSTATMGVTTITNHVSQGLTTVLESGIGAVPNPEELARLHKAASKNPEDDSETSSGLETTFGLGNFVSGVSQITKLVESTSTKVISSGLDTLETIGKKTMEVLQEGDPGLKKKRAFLKIESDKPVLSQMLREAKEKVENENKILEERHFKKMANYESLFDDHQGLVHLEALEMLSKQCVIKLQTVLELQSNREAVEIQETMDQIKELCELTEDDDENILTVEEIKEKLDVAESEMNIPISYGKILITWHEAEGWLDIVNLNVCSERELYEQSINILAQLTAVAVELFHKTGELLLIKEHRSTADEADNLVQLTMTITTLLGSVAKKISDKLNEKKEYAGNKDAINELITNVYFEATNSSTYVKDAFILLIPVLQVGAI